MKQQIHDTILTILEQKKRDGDVLPFATSIEVAHLLHMNAVEVDALLAVREILIEWGMWKEWMPAIIDDYTRNYREKSDVIRFLSDITPIRKAIRKLTERECFRLMDVDEPDIDKIQASGVSRSQQYKMAGNSIVVACMEGIFYNLFSNEEQETLTLF